MYLVAEFGGTNARFTLIEPGLPEHQLHRRQAPCDQFDGVESALDWYLEEVGRPAISAVCLAIAGPTDEPPYRMTNRPWVLTPEAVKKVTGAIQVEVLNDFQALAYSVRMLSADSLYSIREGKNKPASTKVVLGPGTGLGLVALIPVPQGWQVMSGLGGNIGFAPANDIEVQILSLLMKSCTRVTVENLASGSGLVSIYRALAEIFSEQARDYSAADIVELGVEKQDSLCLEALEVFCSVVGGYAGDMVITTGALGGVYLGGGILPRFREFLKQSRFMESFTERDKNSYYLADVPVKLIVQDDPGLIGAACYLDDRMLLSAS